MKKILYLITITLLLHSCGDQELTTSDLVKCAYSTSNDNGKSLKRKMYDFEDVLIKEKLLSDNSGKSYRQIYLIIAEFGNVLQNSKLEKILSQLPELSQTELEIINNCAQKYSWDFAHGNENISTELKNLMTEKKNISASEIAEIFAKNLKDKDFEDEFYKLKTLYLFQSIVR